MRTVLILSCLLPVTAFAQAIDTNRPGFSFSPNVVAQGEWQLETGAGYARFSSDSDSVTLPAVEFRYGVGNSVEVFVSSLGWTDTDFPGGSSSGLVDPSIGSKINLNSSGSNFNSALLFQVSVPIGSSEVSSDSWDPELAFIWARSGPLNLAGTITLSEFDGDFQIDNGLKLPFTLSDTRSAFVEWEVNLPENSGPSHWLNGGYQWLLDDAMQIDFNAGIALNDRAGDYRFGVGFSMKL